MGLPHKRLMIELIREVLADPILTRLITAALLLNLAAPGMKWERNVAVRNEAGE